VPDFAAFLAAPQPSRLARLGHTIGLGLTAVAVAATLAALLAAPSVLRAAAVLAGAAALIFVMRERNPRMPARVGVGAGGAILLDDGEAVAVEYCGQNFVCLRTPGGPSRTVWRDSLAAADWRRLRVACRWTHLPAMDGRALQAGGRTK
jgi:hypothetical protein